jgi:hypothetical protein
MNLMKETKTLIVTETLRYEFTVPASMPENDDALKRFFARHPNPWGGADFAAVTEREFEIEAEIFPCGSFTPPQRRDAARREEETQGSSRTSTHETHEHSHPTPSVPAFTRQPARPLRGGDTIRR